MVDSYQLLANAIVEQAAEDYTRYVCKVKKMTEELTKMKAEIVDLEKFFNGEGITHYTSLDGPKLLEQLKERVEQYNYNYAMIKRSKQKKAITANEAET